MCSPRLLAALALFAGLGCSAGSAAREIRPADPTAKDALGELKCEGTTKGGAPLVVDLEAHDRADLEDAMNDGIAVVSWSCASLKLLNTCKVAGEANGAYAFHGLSPQEFTVKLDDADEIRANLPSFGLGLIGKLESEMKRGATLDLAIALIGKRRTTVSSIARADLSGACDGATHFVRGAYVGAFAMATGTKGDMRAAVEIFKAGADASSKSSRLTDARDGDIDACHAFDGAGALPPPKCRSLVRLELVPIVEARAPRDTVGRPQELEAPLSQCAEGLVAVDHKCAPPGDRPYLCRADQPVECTEQCERGDAQSCGVLGSLYARGEGVPHDDARAFDLLQKSCNSGVAAACVAAGMVAGTSSTIGRDIVREVVFFKKGCDLDDARGCFDYALDLEPSAKGVDLEKVIASYKKACDLGEGDACSNLGLMVEDGRAPHVTDSPETLFTRACDGGSPIGCFNVGRLVDHAAVGRDAKRAYTLYAKACEGKVADACFFAGRALEQGDGTTRDLDAAVSDYEIACGHVASACLSLGNVLEAQKNDKLAAEAYRVGCDHGDESSCVELGTLEAEGRGVAENKSHASTLFDTACAKRVPIGCMNLGALVANGKPPKWDVALKAYEAACDLDELKGCYEAADILSSGDVPKNEKRARALFQRACEGKVEDACTRAKGG